MLIVLLKFQELNKNPIDPRMEIHAYAGPMKRDDAANFRKKWKTPPRTPGSPINKFGSPHFRTPERSDQSLRFRLLDTEKGLERVGRDLAKQYHVGWKEYWPFLGTFADLTSEDGLKLLEDHMSQKHMDAFSDSMDTTRSEISLTNEIVANNLYNSSRSSIVSPMSDLCKNFEACTLSENGISFKKEARVPKSIGKCTNRFNETILDAISKSGLSPFLCIEKSCQVFANRIANHIMFLVENRLNTTADALESEVKHLKSLIGSYMSDIRFNVVKFQSVHWRISHLVSQRLCEIYSYEDEMNEKRQVLESIIKNYDKMVDVFSSDDEDLNSYRQPEKPIRRRSTSNNKQVICLVENILKALGSERENEKKSIITEEDCMEVWSDALVCSCVWKTSSKSGRKTWFFKKGNKYITKGGNCKTPNRSLDNVSRRLSFIEDEIDGKLII